MALQIYLPLNGDLNNYGLTNMTFTNTATNILVDNNGRVGKCYTRAAKAKGRIISNETINLNGDLTMCCWAKVTATVGDTANGLVTNHTAANNKGFGITVKQVSTSDYRISCSTGNGSSRTYMTYYGTTNIKNAWHHLALTYDSTNHQFKLWVDGICEVTQDYTNASEDSKIGVFNWNLASEAANYHPACSIDEVRIYDNMLKESEIMYLASPKKHKKLELWMPMRGSSINFGLENITRTDTSITYASAAKTGGNAVLNATGDKIVCTNFAWQPTDGFTIAAWVKHSNAPASQRGPIVRNADDTGPFVHWDTDHALKVGYSTSASTFNTLTSAFVAAQNTWHHYCGTWDGQKLKLYIDGEWDCQVDATDPIYYASTRGLLQIANTTASGTIVGIVGDVRCYNYALTDSEVYQISLAKVGHYLLNGMPMSTGDKTEYSGIFTINGAASATLTAAARKVAGSPRYQHSFKANGAYIKGVSNAWVYATDEWSFGCWAYAADWTTCWGSATYHSIISCIESGGWGITTASGTTLVGELYYNGAYHSATIPYTDLSAGWHHFIVACDGINITFYLDGTIKTTVAPLSTKYAISQKNYFYIGAECSGSKILANSQFKGQISDVVMYAKYLTLSDVQKLYSKGHIPTT